MLPAAGIVEVIALEGLAPIGQHLDKLSVGEMAGHEIERQIGQTKSGEASLAHLHDAGEDEPALRRDAQVFSTLADVQAKNSPWVGRRRLIQT